MKLISNRMPLMALLVMALATASCGAAPADTDATSTDGTDGTTEGTEEAADGGRIEVLRVGAAGQAGDDLNPLLTNGLADYTAVFHLYDTLVRLTGEEVELALAESIEPNADATEWRIRIREGATFHDGSPVTAADVTASLALMADPVRSPTYASSFADVDIEGMTTADGLTAIVPLHRPRADFVFSVLTFASFVFPEGFEDWASPIGSGPYRLEAYDPDSSIVLTAYEDHWEGAPTVDRIEISVIDDAAARLNAVVDGSLDFALKVDPVDATTADADAVQILRGGSAVSQGMSLVMNTSVAPFDDVEVRRAIALAVDRETLVEAVLLGFGEPGEDVIGMGLPGYAQALPSRQRDVETARSVLQDAGVTELELIVGDVTPGIVAAGEVLIEQLAEVGVDLTLDQRDPAAYYADFAEFTSRPFQGLYYVNRPAPAFLSTFTGSGASFNPSGYATEAYDALLTEAQAETDAEARDALFAEAQAMFQDEGGTIVWGFQEQLDATAPDLDGVQIVQSIPFFARASRS